MRRLRPNALNTVALAAALALCACANPALPPQATAHESTPACAGIAPGSRLDLQKDGPLDLGGCAVTLESVEGAAPADMPISAERAPP
jgi:hypothetical protein